MEIKMERNAGTLTLTVSGRIDTKTAPELEHTIRSELTGVTDLVFDLAETSYISSAGLRVMLIAQKQMAKQGTMVICNANSDLMDIFEVTGFTDILAFR